MESDQGPLRLLGKSVMCAGWYVTKFSSLSIRLPLSTTTSSSGVPLPRRRTSDGRLVVSGCGCVMNHAALRVGASALLVRFLTHDGLSLLPRQPVSYWLAFAPPRLAEMYARSLLREQRAASALFDGDVTPWIWAACIATLVISGGMRKSVLWSSPSARFFTFIVFILSPLGWMHRTHLSVLVAAQSHQTLLDGLPLKSESHKVSSLFNMHDLMTNAQWHPHALAANQTLIYKRAKTHPSSVDFCSRMNPFALPGDAFFVENREDMSKGVLKMDIYQPAVLPDEAKPVVMHIHGGGWDKGVSIALFDVIKSMVTKQRVRWI